MINVRSNRRHLKTLCVVLLAASLRFAAFAQESPKSGADKPYVIEYYYKARWGFADEFIRLFKKNHYPVLKKELELGRILKLSASAPRFHATDDGRWDYRVTIVWKNVTMTADGYSSEAMVKTLFPDQETFKKEEQRRFEILLGHWDVPVNEVDLDK